MDGSGLLNAETPVSAQATGTQASNWTIGQIQLENPTGVAFARPCSNVSNFRVVGG